MRRTLTILTLACLASQASAQCEPVESDAIGSRLNDVHRIGDLAFSYGGEDGYLVFDVSDPAAISLVAAPELAAHGLAMDVVGTTAYMLESRGLVIVDVSDPLAPVTLGSIDSLGNAFSCWDVAVSGGIACVVNGYAEQLFVIDVSDPAAPKLLATEEVGEPFGVEIIGNYAYVCVQEFGPLHLYDISDPADPTYAGNANIHDAHDVFHHGNRAYVAGEHELTILDVTFPNQPEVLGDVALDYSRNRNVSIIGTYAYISGDDALTVVDVSDPDDMIVVEQLPIGFGVTEVLPVPGGALALERRGWMTTLNVDDPAHPTIVQQMPILGFGDSLALDASLAYVIDGVGLYVLDTESEFPALALSYTELPGDYEFDSHIEQQGDIVYAWRQPQLSTWDVSDPASPKMLASINESIKDMVIEGDYLYAAGSPGLRIIDVSDPANPHLIATEAFTSTKGLAVSGAHVYLAGSDGLGIVDVSDPGSPDLVGTLAVTNPNDVSALGDLACLISSTTNDVVVVDVSDPAAPAQLSSIDIGPGFDESIEIIGDVVLAEHYGWAIIDITDPANPKHIGDLPFTTYNDHVAGDESILFTGSRPVFEYDLSSCPSCPSDLNDDGELNVLDFITFQLLWQAGDERADCDANGDFSIIDFICYQAVFTLGCE